MFHQTDFWSFPSSFLPSFIHSVPTMLFSVEIIHFLEVVMDVVCGAGEQGDGMTNGKCVVWCVKYDSGWVICEKGSEIKGLRKLRWTLDGKCSKHNKQEHNGVLKWERGPLWGTTKRTLVGWVLLAVEIKSSPFLCPLSLWPHFFLSCAETLPKPSFFFSFFWWL